MSIVEEAKRLDDIVASIDAEWKEQLKNLETEIQELNAILADKESKTDRSENATFQIATDNRDIKMSAYDTIRHKVEKLASSKRDYVSTGVVTVGSTVEVKPVSINGSADVDMRGHRVIRIVDEGLSAADKFLVGTDSALGAALLGHKVKDSVSCKTRKGIITYSIEEMY